MNASDELVEPVNPLKEKIPSFLSEVEPDCIDFLRKATARTVYKKGEILLSLGELCPDTLLVGKGLLVAEAMDATGALTPVHFLHKGDAAAPTVVPTEPSPLQYRTLCNSVVFRAPCVALVEACLTWPRFSIGLTARLLQNTTRARIVHARLDTLHLGPKLAYFLWSLSEPVLKEEGFPRFIASTIPQQLLGAYFKAPREEVNRKLKAFEAAGYCKKVGTGLALSLGLCQVFQAEGVLSPDSPFFNAT